MKTLYKIYFAKSLEFNGNTDWFTVYTDMDCLFQDLDGSFDLFVDGSSVVFVTDDFNEAIEMFKLKKEECRTLKTATCLTYDYLMMSKAKCEFDASSNTYTVINEESLMHYIANIEPKQFAVVCKKDSAEGLEDFICGKIDAENEQDAIRIAKEQMEDHMTDCENDAYQEDDAVVVCDENGDEIARYYDFCANEVSE